MIRRYHLIAALLAATVCGCKSLPVTEVHPGVFAALGDDPQEAIEHATKFCRREEHARFAVAVDNVQAVAAAANNGHRGIEVRSNSTMGFTMNAGSGSEHEVVFRFSCSN